MKRSPFSYGWTVVFGLCLAVTGALAQTKDYAPQVGQAGKDVVWVPTDQALVDIMLDLAKVTPADYVIDLGSGDGRTVITAAKRGARALGIEYNPDMVALSLRSAEKEGVSGRASFRKADLFETDLSEATVITMFLLPSINLKLRPTLLGLRPGTRIVSNSFTMEEWKADQTASLPESCITWCTAYLWIVPAAVQGTWEMDGGRLELGQDFQMVTGSLRAGHLDTLVSGKVAGDRIDFDAAGVHYTGRVEGDAMSGIRTSAGQSAPWKAVRR
jgi:precorrin-6B methylase 2